MISASALGFKRFNKSMVHIFALCQYFYPLPFFACSTLRKGKEGKEGKEGGRGRQGMGKGQTKL